MTIHAWATGMAAAVVAAALLAPSRLETAETPAEVVVRGATIVDVDRGQAIPAQDLVVRGTRIAQIAASGPALPAAKTSIDARGKFVIPGLVAAPVRLAAFSPPTLQGLLAVGVTAVGDVGTEAAVIAQWRRDLASGRLYAPHLAEGCGRRLDAAPLGVTTGNTGALHDELARAVANGRTPAEALRTATLDAARALCLDAGVVAPGAPADFVVLSADPLADIRSTRAIDAVVFRGQVFTQAHVQMLRRGTLPVPTPTR